MVENPHRAGFTRAVVPLAFFTLFFLLNGILGYFSIRNIEENQREVTRSLETISFINGMYLELLRAESGQRGYLLTDLDSYLVPFDEAAAVLDARLEDLLEAGLDDTQQTSLYELRLLVDEKVDEMLSSVAARREEREMDAIELLFSHRGRNIMSEISAVIERMKLHENGLLEQRLEATRDSRRMAFILILLANLSGLLMVFATFTLVRRMLRKDEEFARTLQAANDSLEAKVEERTAALSHYSSELRRSNRELQDFAFIASHDLQEPLRKIRAFGDRLQENYAEQLGDQGRDYLERMQRASARMSTLISDLLSFSRITTRAEPFLKIPLAEVVDEVLDDLEIAIEESSAEIEVGPLPEVEADRSQMKQLFQNLIGNAIKFRRENVPPRVVVAAGPSASPESEPDADTDDWVEIRVSDNGIGFDTRFLDRIFTPFQRLHGRSGYSGTGIGLAVCRRIVERHGGTITARSRPGEGSTFIIRLPRENTVYELED